jgi:NTP pyrophosphatase (non-canonical NTP hydrolase)
MKLGEMGCDCDGMAHKKPHGEIDPPGTGKQPAQLEHLDLAELRHANTSRARRWHSEDTAPWSLADWSNAMCGEAGEAANVVKKIRRHETHVSSSYNTPALDELYEALTLELADLVIYADLVAANAGIDLAAAIRRKFNEVSAAQDFPERIGPTEAETEQALSEATDLLEAERRDPGKVARGEEFAFTRDDAPSTCEPFMGEDLGDGLGSLQ